VAEYVSEMLFRGIAEFPEGLLIRHSQFSQHLGVKAHIGDLQPLHQSAVVEAKGLAAGVDARNPESPERAFSGPAVAKGIDPGPRHCFGAPLRALGIFPPKAISSISRHSVPSR